MLSAITGAVTGAFVAGFERLVVTDTFEHILGLSPWIIAVLPVSVCWSPWPPRRFVGGGVPRRPGIEYLYTFRDPATRWD